ncbi:MAG: LysR substrate-binding domain-containing protein [Cytophagales bacterium]|jgi:LysR family hydrogen peroxide-inducible transcriptional activator|nr:LysR substrate-binding domain-containing protein [Cytophagales bacterium]
MNIHQLEYILAVDQFKSFSKAADYCHVTQATLSAMVKKLEEELDIVIFDRKASPISATENGLEILGQALQVVAHANALLDSSKSINRKMEGKVKLGVIPTIANSLLLIILKPLLEKYPALIFEIQEQTTQQLMKSLLEGKLDLGILSTPISSSDLETELLYKEKLVLYGHVQKASIKKAELSQQRFFLLQDGHCLRDQIIQLCELKKNKFLPVNLRFEANTFETLLNLVDDFQGVTILPKLYAEQLSDKRRAAMIELEEGNLEREVSLCYYRPYAKWNIINRLAADIRELVKEHLS